MPFGKTVCAACSKAAASAAAPEWSWSLTAATFSEDRKVARGSRAPEKGWRFPILLLWRSFQLLSRVTLIFDKLSWKIIKKDTYVVVFQLLKLCLTLCNPMDCSLPGFPVLHHLLEFAQVDDHWAGDAIQPSHHLSSPSPPALNLSEHQGLFQWVGSSHQVAKVLEFQL